MTDAFRIDYDTDEDRADPGWTSRYAVYLRDHAAQFDEVWTDEDPTSAAVRFAAAAWCVARPPIMTGPPLVRAHPRVISAQARWDDYDGRHLIVDVELISSLPAALSRLEHRWETWQHNETADTYEQPGSGRRPTPHMALSMLTLVVPIPGPGVDDSACLPLPSARVVAIRRPDPDRPAPPNLADAFASVGAIVTILNPQLQPILDALDHSSW